MRASHRLSLLLLVLVLVLAAGNIAIGSAQAAAGPRVTVIGDSVSAALTYVPDAVAQLGAGLDLRLELAVCRRLVEESCPYQGSRPPSTLDVIRDGTRPLGTIVAIDVGYNEPLPSFPDAITRTMQALVQAGAEHVLWLTLTEERASYATMNGQLRDAARRWPQLTIVDWGATSAGRPWFADDGLHLNVAGARGLAMLLRTSILAVCGQECEQPRSLVRVAIPVIAARPTLSVDLPETWRLSSGAWRRWSGVASGWLGPQATAGADDGALRVAALLRPRGTSLAEVRAAVLAAPAQLGVWAAGVTVAGDRFVTVPLGRAWQVDTRTRSAGGVSVSRWTFVRGGDVTLGSGATRSLVYVFRASCAPTRCNGSGQALARIVRSLRVD